MEAGKSGSGFQHSCSLMRGVFLAYRWPSSHLRLHDRECKSKEEGERERKRVGERPSSSYKDTVLTDKGPTLMTSFNLKYLLKILSPDTDTLGG